MKNYFWSVLLLGAMLVALSTSAAADTGYSSTPPASSPPSGAAGGDLSGTYPNPTVAKANGASVPASGALTTGNVLQVNGASALTYSAVNLAGGANFVTGALPDGNQASQTLSGDVTGNTGASVVSAISGVSPIAITPNNLQWAATATPQLTEATPGSDATVHNMLVQAQAPNASATVNTSAGNVLIATQASVGAGTVPQAEFIQGSTENSNVAASVLWNPANSFGYVTLGSKVNTANYMMAANGSGNALLFSNGSHSLVSGTASFSSAGLVVTSAVATYRAQLRGDSSVSNKPLSYQTQAAIDITSGASLSAAQYTSPVIRLSSSALGGDQTVTLPNVTGAVWFFDLGGVSFNGHNVIFSTGSGTTVSVSSSAFVSGQLGATIGIVASNVVVRFG